MKKILTVALMIVMVMSLTLAASAKVGGFIQSPSNNHAPGLVSSLNIDPECIAKVIVTAYIDREELPVEKRLLLEEAYSLIAANPDLSNLTGQLISLAKELGINVKDLAVSDLFDISSTDCSNHENHGHFDIILESDTRDNFVCLLHYDKDEWTVVEGAKVTHGGTHLEFDATEFSPFAIVVNTNPDAVVDEEPEEIPANKRHGIYMLVADISGFALIGLAIAYKKSKS